METIDLRRIKPPDEVGAGKRKALFPVLAPLSLLYGLGMRLWRRLPLEAFDPGIPVISVGSLSVGGTGKTPLTMAVARRVAGRGLATCIISRGYRRKEKASPLLVSDGRRVLVGVGAAGDEPYMMAERLGGVAVVVGGDRAAAARLALDRLRPDLIVLDDGFQCRSLAKSAEVVCLDSKSLSAGSATLPLGILREPWAAIEAAHLVVLVLREGEAEPALEDLARLGSRPVFTAVRTGARLLKGASAPGAHDPPFEAADLPEGSKLGGDWKAARVVLVSGIARPESFETGCAELGMNVVASLRFEDHHWYTERDAERVKQVMERHSATHLVTTEKDFYKLPGSLSRLALFLRIDLALVEEDRFWNALDTMVGG
jgi:tetraacyldisaccharide 4'-kinase